MRKISIFGATGSVGCNTVDLINRDVGRYQIVALSGGNNIALLAKQAIALNAEIAVTSQDSRLDELRQALQGSGVEAAAGTAALVEAASRPVDWAMSAIVGFAGLNVSLALAAQGGILALANKESLVCAGPLLKEICAGHGTKLLPVDSEHSAIFQALNGEDPASVSRIILTASGGPFLRLTQGELAKVTPAQAMAHPKWNMGDRISIDSASMFNKAMEMIETKELFDVDQDMIEVIIHPQSIIHSMVGYRDGAFLAHLGPADMRGPIGYALNWPERQELPLQHLDLAALGRLDFETPDGAQFPAIDLAREVMRLGGLTGTVFNAAKEQTLDLFLAGQIRFPDMARLVAAVLEKTYVSSTRQTVDYGAIADSDDWARKQIKALV